MSIALTNDQQNAVNALTQFLADDSETAFVLSGYAGTGKSTLIRYVLDNIDKTLKAIRLVKPNTPHYQVQLTATTNKAADNLAQITKDNVPTIHSYLGLRVETNYQTRATKLVESNKVLPDNQILFIDEASYIDSPLLALIFKKMSKSKIVFIGDPAQLIPVKSSNAPVFFAPFPKAELTQVVRQAQGNPVLDLATKFRETVNTGDFFSFTPDGNHVRHVDQDTFNQLLRSEFIDPKWTSQRSKILAWTNKTVNTYNKAISELVSGRTNFAVGDYVQCNKFFQTGKTSIKTDALVLITNISAPETQHGISGHTYTLDGKVSAFCPDSLSEKKKLLSKAKAEENYELVNIIEEHWIDLREVYSCTINKSQGSTYDRVFIDLDDISKCNSGEQISRLLYVGVSRARYQVIFTGDLV